MVAQDDYSAAASRGSSQIAEVLDRPIESFTSGRRQQDDLESTVELLRVWSEIRSDEVRLRVLKLIRECALS